MTRYLLNSAVITAPGRYTYQLITDATARYWYEWEGVCDVCGAGDKAAGKRWIGRHHRHKTRVPPISTIGYAETAAALGELLGVGIPVDRRSIIMQPHDKSLVFRLVFPPGTPRIDPKDKGALGAALVAGHYELGLLIRTA